MNYREAALRVPLGTIHPDPLARLRICDAPASSRLVSMDGTGVTRFVL